MKAVALTINGIAVIAVFFFLWSNSANAQETINYVGGNVITVTENGWSNSAGSQGSLSVFQIDSNDISGNTVSPVPPRVEYCSAGCTNGNYGVTVLDNDTTEQYSVDVSGYANGEYVFVQRNPNAFTDFDFAHSEWGNQNVQFSVIETFLYTVIQGGKIRSYSYESGTINPFNLNSGHLYLQPEYINSFALRLFLVAPQNQTTASFTEPMLASVIQGVQDTGQNIWPLFVLAGIPLAFIIALQLVVFTRRSIAMKTVEFDDAKADELEKFYSKTGNANPDELASIRKIERNR